jgi:hypothetical protein
LEVDEEVGGIYSSGCDLQGMEVGTRIGNTRQAVDNTSNLTYEPIGVTRNWLVSIMVVPTPTTSP